MKNLQIKIIISAFIIIFGVLFGLTFSIIKLNSEILSIKLDSEKIDNTYTSTKNDELSSPSPKPITQTQSQQNLATKEYVDSLVSKAIATVSAQKSTTTTSLTKPKTQTTSTFIPLGGSFTTNNTDWTDVKNAEVWIDLYNEYGETAKVSWDAFLKVEHGNGKAFARLMDVTHGIAVDGSEILTTNSNLSQVTSSYLPFWRGKNLYRVQIKSLSGFNVTVDSARIKVSY